MLRLTDGQLRLWDRILPPEATRLSEELAKVDKWLSNEELFEPYRKKFRTRTGRPTVPVDTFLRLMYLKSRYNLGYESLVQEVTDSLQWRRFCRIPLDGRVPDPSTLIKLVKRYGDDTVKEVNKQLMGQAREHKVLKGRKLRVDTTVVEANIHHPTDASLLADGIHVITRTIKKIKAVASEAVGSFRDRGRTVKKHLLEIAKVLRRRTGEAYQEVRRITGEIMDVTKEVTRAANRVASRVKEAIEKATDDRVLKAKKLIERLESQIAVTEKVIQQTQEVQNGNTHIPNRIVSMFDPDARPIPKGKLKAPTEFGYKVVLGESEERLITDYDVFVGNPSDESLLLDVVDHHKEIIDSQLKEVATDRGFTSQNNERELMIRDVINISLPCRGKPSKTRQEVERRPWFRRLQRWRAGQEATIGLLKSRYGLARSRSRGLPGTKSWVGFGVLAYNLRRLSVIG